MKKILMIATTLGLAVSSSYAQGFFSFDNSTKFSTTAPNPTAFFPSINTFHAPGEGNTGDIIGSDPTFATPNYDVSYLWMAGTANAGHNLTAAEFKALGAVQGGLTTSFAGPTSTAANEPNTLAGVITGPAAVPAASGQADGALITIQLIAWYDNTGNTTYDQAFALGHNVGFSQTIQVRLAAGTDPVIADLSTVPGFEVGGAPEPSILTLSGLGAAAFLVARKRKTKSQKGSLKTTEL